MKAYDLAVIGAGPAGSSAARAAAAAGARVVLVEKKAKIGFPVRCAEFVPALIGTLAGIPGEAVAQAVDYIDTYYPDGGREVTKAPGYTLNRELFDAALTEEAARAGAAVWLRTTAVGVEGNRVLLQYEGVTREIRAAAVIGADGPVSRIAAGLGMPRRPLAAAAQVELILPEPVKSAIIYFHHLYRGGYAWVFPKGRTANAGVALLPGKLKPLGALAHFLRQLGYRNCKVVRRIQGVVPTGGPYPLCSRNNVLLCGDAGGFTNPLTGAGILTAVISGRLAGEAAAFYAGGGEPLQRYEEAWRDLLGGVMRSSLSKRLRWNEAWSNDAGRLTKMLRQTWLA